MDGKQKELLQNLRKELNTCQGKAMKMLIGLDGFVDEIIHVVNTRKDFENFDRVETIAQFGERICRAAGLSANIEFVPMQVKLGGNGPIFANALMEMGVDIIYTGALGKPDIHPVFKPMAEKCRVYSICDPGHTDAVEFNDGKLMLGKIEVLNSLTWEALKEVFGGVEALAAEVAQCDMLGMENWTMVPHMSEVWEGLINEVFPLLPYRQVKPLAFFDLADPEKRRKEDILNAMKLIGRFESKFRAVLGLNEKEAYEIAEVLGVEVNKAAGREEELRSLVTGIYKKLDIYCLVVHPTKEAACAVPEGYFRIEGPYCANPVLTTGAGDNFNAGFILGLSLGLSAENALLTGVISSGFYVRMAGSSDYQGLLDFAEKWENGLV